MTQIVCVLEENLVVLCLYTPVLSSVPEMEGGTGEASFQEDVALVQCMHLVLNFTHMPDESHNRWLTSLLLCLCDVFRVLISSLFIPSAGHLIQILNVDFNATSEQLQLTTGHSSPVSC